MSCATSRTSSSICGRAPTTPLRAEDRKSTKTSPRRRPKRKTAASDTRAERCTGSSRNSARQNSTPRVQPVSGENVRARLKFSNERRLLQELHERTAWGPFGLLGVNRAVIVRIGSGEAFLDE